MKKIIISIVLGSILLSPLSCFAVGIRGIEVYEIKEIDGIINSLNKRIEVLEKNQNQEVEIPNSDLILKLEAEVKETRSLMDIILQLLTALQKLVGQLLAKLI